MLGIRNAFGGDYGKTKQWFTNNGYGDLLRSNSPTQPSMFDMYWTMLRQYDQAKQEADAARRVGFGEAFAREGLRGLAGITELENRLLSPLYWGIDASSKAITSYDPRLRAIPDYEAEQRNSLAIQPYEEPTFLGKIGEATGQALPMVATAPLADAAIPAEGLTTVPEIAPTLWNATKTIAAKIPGGVGSMTPAAALASQDAADQGGSLEDQIKAASLTMATGAIPMLAKSDASSLPLRIAERGAKSAALAIPINAEINSLLNPNRKTAAGFTSDDIASAIPQIFAGALTGGREVPFHLSAETRPSEGNLVRSDGKASGLSDPFLSAMRAALDADAAAEAARKTDDITFSKGQTPEERVGRAWLELGRDVRTAALGETPTEKDFPSILRKLAGPLANQIEVSEARTPNGEVWGYRFAEPGNPGRTIILDLSVPGEAYVNSSRAGDHSTPIYQAIYAWAHNNGQRIVEDPVGLSDVAQLRRTSQMLSSAIRYGTTRHIEPGPFSGIQGWNSGDGESEVARNIGLLARREAELVRERLPFVRQMRYAPRENAFHDGKRRLPAEDLASYLRQRIAGFDPKFARGVGPATLKRALVTLAAERAEFGGFGLLVGASAKEASLKSIRYGKVAEPFPSEATEPAFSAGHAAAIRAAALDEAWKLGNPPHVVVHRDAASIDNEYLRRRV